jgi:OOP family OmpA-OmpF porin
VRAVALPVLLPAAALLLAGCTAAPDDDVPEETPVADEAAGPSPDDVVVTRTLTAGGTDVTAEIHPLVRADEHVVLTVDLTADDVDPDGLFLGSYFGGTSVIPLSPRAGIRLFDLTADAVHEPGTDADGDVVSADDGGWVTVEPEGTRIQLVYAAPSAETEALGLFLPGAAYVEQVPVVDGDVPGPEVGESSPEPTGTATGEPAATAGPTASAGAGADDAESLDPDAVVDAPVLPFESYTRELAGAVATLQSTEQVEITLGSDVLFAPDSADLSPQAQAALDAAAAHLAGREPGTIAVVGHTDDVDDDAHNQDLSERRAQAVASALAERIDTAEYPIETSGRGETEPVVPNDGDAERARNRRVTLTLTSQVTTATDVETTGELPPFDGPVGTGAEGVEIDATRPYRITAPEARLVDGHVVVDLQITALDDEVDSAFGIGALSGVFAYRADTWTTQNPASGVTLLSGSTAVYPMDYRAGTQKEGAAHELWLPAADLDTLGRIDGGQTRTFSIVYPAIGDLDTVTVQVDEGLGSDPFRLTDIPVG